MTSRTFKQNLLKMKALLFTLGFYLIFVALGCSGCGGVKKGQGEVETTDIEKKVPTHELPPAEASEHRRPHPDSIKKWNDKVAIDKEQHTLKPDKDTKYFTIDENTGEVIGCPLLKLAGEYNWKEDSINNAKEQAKFNKLLPKLEKAWLGTKEIVRSEEFPEGEDRYPTHGLFSKNDEYLVVPDGFAHGGTVNKIYFFNKKGELVSKYELGFHLQVPNYRFNDEKTFFILSSSVSPYFYFFYPDGRLFKKGNYHEMTGDNGTSYGTPLVTETGKNWILKNNLNWVYKNENEFLNKIYGNIICINDNSIALVAFQQNIYSKNYQLQIIDLISKKIMWNSNDIMKSKNRKYLLNTNEK
jgi:hypothetical protein